MVKGGVKMNMFDFSNHVIALANREGNGITNLELQKVMYFAIGSYIKHNGVDEFIESIYDEPFEAWPYGPVVRSVYFEHKVSGRSKISDEPEYNADFAALDPHITEYLGVPIRDLVDESHEHSIWKDNKKQIMMHETIEYELGDIEDAFID